VNPSPAPESDIEVLRDEVQHELYDDLLTLDQACYVLDLSADTLRKRFQSGQLSYIQIGKVRYVPRSVIVDYVRSLRPDKPRDTQPGAVDEELPTIGGEQ